MFDNTLYAEEYDMDHPTTCPNIYNRALHGIINPLFEVQTDLLDVDFNCDSLSCCCLKSYVSGDDIDCSLDFSVDEVLDRPNFENQPALHAKIFDDCSSTSTSTSYDGEFSSVYKNDTWEPTLALGYQFVPKYVNCHLYSKHDPDSVFSFPLQCEDDDGFFLVIDKTIENLHDVGIRNDRDNVHLPRRNVNENKVYDRGKWF